MLTLDEAKEEVMTIDLPFIPTSPIEALVQKDLTVAQLFRACAQFHSMAVREGADVPMGEPVPVLDAAGKGTLAEETLAAVERRSASEWEREFGEAATEDRDAHAAALEALRVARPRFESIRERIGDTGPSEWPELGDTVRSHICMAIDDCDRSIRYHEAGLAEAEARLGGGMPQDWPKHQIELARQQRDSAKAVRADREAACRAAAVRFGWVNSLKLDGDCKFSEIPLPDTEVTPGGSRGGRADLT